MRQEHSGCLRMMSDLVVAALVLILTVLVLVLVSRAGGPEGATPTPDRGTPSEVSEALEQALEQR